FNRCAYVSLSCQNISPAYSLLRSIWFDFITKAAFSCSHRLHLTWLFFAVHLCFVVSHRGAATPTSTLRKSCFFLNVKLTLTRHTCSTFLQSQLTFVVLIMKAIDKRCLGKLCGWLADEDKIIFVHRTAVISQ
uniref:Uncharacterized protein n=1 Tax=Parascaris univalens TaxID=6257 RepID=A0A915BB51_PARUN